MATPPVPKPNPKKRNALIENLLDLIIIAEGTNLDKTLSKNRDPYNTIVGYDKITFDKPLTEMTLKEVRENGRSIVNATRGVKGKKGSSAVGAFQLLSNEYNSEPYTSTVGEFQKILDLPDDTLFTKEVQRELAKAKIIRITNKGKLLDNFVANPSEKNLKNILNKLGEEKGWQGIPTASNKNKPRINFEQAISAIGTDEVAFQPNIIDINVIDPELDVNDQTKKMLKEEKAEPAKKEKAEPAKKERIDPDRPPQATKDKPKLMEFEGVEPFNEEERTIKLQMEAINPMGSANADESLTSQSIPQLPESTEVDDLSMPEENAASDYEKAFDKYDGELPEEEKDSISYSEATEPEDTVVDREGMDYDTPEVTMEADPEIGEFIANLFNSKNLMADETEMFDDQEYQNLKEGGEVEADFVDDDKEDDAADPPPGATPEQVADDIPAMLSEGEYVLPANVVNFIGLKNITEMHQAVLDEIQQMADLGFVENVDENGKPEDDDDEMPKVKKNGDVESPDDIEKSATLIIASASPKGMMCPEPVMLKDGGADFDPFGGSEAEVEFEAEAEFDPMGSQETDFNTDIGPGATELDLAPTSPKFDPFMDNLMTAYETVGPPVKTIADKFAQFNENMSQIRAETREEAAEKAYAENPNATRAEIDEAMNAAFASPAGFSEKEDAAFEGGAKGMNEGVESPGGPNNMDGFISDAELEVASSSVPTTGAYKRQVIPGVGLVRDGGLMAKEYNTGGQVTNFVPDVGIVPISTGLEMDQLPSSSLMSFEDILTKTRAPVAEAYGFKSWEEASKAYKDKPKLEGAELRRRQKDARYITNSQFRGIDGSNQYAKDPFLENKLRKYGIDFENFAEVMGRYKRGEKMLSNTMSVAENEKLKNDLTGYAVEKRTSRFGFTPQDASQLPEGSTNKDALKSLFRTQINFEEDSVDQDNTDLAGNSNDPKGFQRRFKPSAHRTFKEGVLNEGIVDPKIEQYLRLDEPMNVETVNRVTAYLNTGGDQQYIDPNNEKYSEDIFAKYDDLKALSPSSGLLSPSKDLGTYVKDVGFV